MINILKFLNAAVSPTAQQNNYSLQRNWKIGYLWAANKGFLSFTFVNASGYV